MKKSDIYWYDPNEIVPEQNKDVLVVTKDNKMRVYCIDGYDEEGRQYWRESEGRNPRSKPVRWASLPDIK